MLSEGWTYVMSGAFVSAFLGLFTLKSKIRKSAAETEAKQLENEKLAARILMEEIVEPLRTELNDIREEFYATKIEMQQLRQAINAANSCAFRHHCPVLQRLHECGKDRIDAVDAGTGNSADGEDDGACSRRSGLAGVVARRSEGGSPGGDRLATAGEGEGGGEAGARHAEGLCAL